MIKEFDREPIYDKKILKTKIFFTDYQYCAKKKNTNA